MTALFGEIIERPLNGDMKDKTNENGWTYIEQLARDMFLNPKKAAELIAKASAGGCLPGIKASVERAVALNAPKLALLATAERIKKRGEYDRRYCEPGKPAFYLDMPFRFQPLDKRHGPHVYLPLHRRYKPLGTNYNGPWPVPNCDDHADLAWHFRRDPREIKGAWTPKEGHDYFVYTTWDYGNSLRNEKPFLNEYRRRLRILLAEAVPGVGGLSLEPEW